MTGIALSGQFAISLSQGALMRLQNNLPRKLLVVVSNHSLYLSLALICLIIFPTLALAGGGDKKDKEKGRSSEEVEVKNFGKVNDRIYRGGQPDEDEYKQLAVAGIKTIIDLRDDAKERAHRLATRAGMQYINLPLDDKTPPTQQESDRFLKLINDQSNWPVFVHCAGGRHRTGVLLAVYRMEFDGWNAEQAYREMKDYDFYSSWGHIRMKDFVFDYYKNLLIVRARNSAPPRSRPRLVDESGRKE